MAQRPMATVNTDHETRLRSQIMQKRSLRQKNLWLAFILLKCILLLTDMMSLSIDTRMMYCVLFKIPVYGTQRKTHLNFGILGYFFD